MLGKATVREGQEVPKHLSAALIRAALRGDPLPLTVAEAAMTRLRLEKNGFGDYLATARIGLIRCTLNRRSLGERTLMPGLDPDNNQPAYLCGRLLATLEAIQYAGVGDVGANIVDRFYGKASTAPALVFGPLLTLAQSHLGAINNEGQRVNLNRELSDIIGRLEPDLPRTLNLEDQGRFAIGYYHQKAYRFAETRRRKDERAAKTSAPQQPHPPEQRSNP
jgi:CRISPR-associated protein Csd1